MARISSHQANENLTFKGIPRASGRDVVGIKRYQPLSPGAWSSQGRPAPFTGASLGEGLWLTLPRPGNPALATGVSGDSDETWTGSGACGLLLAARGELLSCFIPQFVGAERSPPMATPPVCLTSARFKHKFKQRSLTDVNREIKLESWRRVWAKKRYGEKPREGSLVFSGFFVAGWRAYRSCLQYVMGNMAEISGHR